MLTRQNASILPAVDLFTLEPDRPSGGLPDFANLRARPRAQWSDSLEALSTPGIYGLFLCGKLFYVGIAAGAGGKTFGGTVLDRWYKHLTYQTLRSPKISFAGSAMRKILRELKGGPSDAFASLMEAGGWSSPLIAKKGGSCTFNKARFATEHWDILRPGREEDMLKAISFVYARLSPVDSAHLSMAPDRAGYHAIKHGLLAKAERRLIDELCPACNAGERVVRKDVGIEAFSTALGEALAGSLAEFSSSPATVQTDAMKPELAESEDDEMIEGEAAFRQKLDAEGQKLVSGLMMHCPPGFEVGFTDKPDLRIWLKEPHRMLVTLASRASGSLLGETYASEADCRALGVVPHDFKDRKTCFNIDPAQVSATTLLQVALAAYVANVEYKATR